MEFLSRLESAERERLCAAGRAVELARGAYLMRRGEASSELYLVESGALEVVDTRSRPEVVLDVLGPGGLVGEMTFLDLSPRAADVRAAADSRCLRWDRGVLFAVLKEDEGLAVAFYRALAAIMVDRVRAVTTNAVAGGLGRARGMTTITGPAMARDAYDLAEASRARWQEPEARLRVDPSDAAARGKVRTAAEALIRDASDWLGRVPDPGRVAEAGQVLARELHAFLVRSRMVALSWESAKKAGGRPELIGHVLGDACSGDGALGEALDAALLASPTPVAMRWRMGVAPVLAARGAASRSARSSQRVPVLIINGVASGFPARFVESWASFRGGALVVTALGPASDAPLFDHVLDWPMVRRPAQVMGSLMAAAGFTKVQLHAEGAAVVVMGLRRDEGALPSQRRV